MQEKRLLMDEAAVRRTLTRLSHEVVEKNKGADNLCLVGIKRRGEIVARRVSQMIREFYGVQTDTGGIDIGMYRDDLVSGFFIPEAGVNDLGFPVDGKCVILCDDILHTGRTVRAAIEALFGLGRPAEVRLLIFADRGGREMPVCADFAGKNISAGESEFLDLSLKEIEGEDALYLCKG